MACAERSAPAASPSSKAVQWALGTLFVAYFTGSMIFSAVTVALPRIAAELDGMRLFSWALAFPSLAIALGTLLSGKLSEPVRPARAAAPIDGPVPTRRRPERPQPDL
jgi:MFS family permease